MLGAWLPVVSIMLGRTASAGASCVPTLPRSYVVPVSHATVQVATGTVAVAPRVSIATIPWTDTIATVPRCSR